MSVIGAPCLTVRARGYNCRTFFIANPDPHIAADVRQFCDRRAILTVSLHTG